MTDKTEILRLESDGIDVEHHVDAVTKYLRAEGFPFMDARRVDFQLAGGGQSGCWFLSEILDVTPVRIFRAYAERHGFYTNGGIMYVSHSWNEAMFVIEEHYYFLSK